MAKRDYDRFRRELRARLEPLSAELTAALRVFRARRFTRRARPEFRVIEDDLGLDGTFPVVLDFVTPGGTVLAGKTEAVLSDGADRGPLCPPDWVAAYEPLNPEEDWHGYAADVVIEWFADCWAAAGGPAPGPPVLIGRHNNPDRRFDLAPGGGVGDTEDG